MILSRYLPHGNKPWKFFSLDHTEEVSDGEVVRLEVEQQLVPVNRGHLQHALQHQMQQS